MGVIGIDQSFSKTGIVVVDGDDILHFETLTTSKSDDNYTRAAAIAADIVSIATRYGCTVANIEGIAFGSRGNVTRDLAGLQYVIVTQLRAVGIDVHVIAPPTLKKSATGNGRCDKAGMISAVPTDVLNEFQKAGYKKTTGLADLADAFHLAMVG